MEYLAPLLFIGGKLRASGDGASFHVVNPGTRVVIAELPVATKADLDEALAAAATGFKIWRAISAYDRAQILRAAAVLMREGASRIGAMMTIEQGKPIVESIAETFACADIFDWYAEEARRAYGRIIPSKPSVLAIWFRRSPLAQSPPSPREISQPPYPRARSPQLSRRDAR